MFGIPITTKFDHGFIESMACHSSCPELSKCVSSVLHKLEMTDLTLKAAHVQRSAVEAIYNREAVFVWLPTGYGKSLYYQVQGRIQEFKKGLGVLLNECAVERAEKFWVATPILI